MKKSFRPFALVLLPLLGWATFSLGLSMIGATTITAATTVAHAADDSQEVRLTVRGSGLPVPRFVTLKSDEVNMRAGPGTEYPILWHYRKTGLPLRVEAEFGVWRKVVDHDGTTGWMHHSVVSLKRMALVTTSSARLYADADDSAALIAVAERNALLELQSCPTQWCRVATGDIRGWVSRTSLWGLVEGEILN
jgi:SH3-like domain-containing protein